MDGRGTRRVVSRGSGDLVCAWVRRMLAFVSRERIGGALATSSFFAGMSSSVTDGSREFRRFGGTMFVREVGENPLFAR